MGCSRDRVSHAQLALTDPRNQLREAHWNLWFARVSGSRHAATQPMLSLSLEKAYVPSMELPQRGKGHGHNTVGPRRHSHASPHACSPSGAVMNLHCSAPRSAYVRARQRHRVFLQQLFLLSATYSDVTSLRTVRTSSAERRKFGASNNICCRAFRTTVSIASLPQEQPECARTTSHMCYRFVHPARRARDAARKHIR